MVADAMVTLGFLEKDGDRYRNAPAASTFSATLGLKPLNGSTSLLVAEATAA
jgi:hypothetical protein